jgi:hypothetical protein
MARRHPSNTNPFLLSHRIHRPGKQNRIFAKVRVGLFRVTELVKHFKTTQVLMALYEKWKEGYPYGYEFVDALHQNEIYSQL